jgi:hypothetical protein
VVCCRGYGRVWAGQVDEDGEDEEDDGSHVYQDLDENDTEDSDAFRKDPATGRTLSEFGLLMRQSRIPVPLPDTAIDAAPAPVGPPTATVSRVIERSPPASAAPVEDAVCCVVQWFGDAATSYFYLHLSMLGTSLRWFIANKFQYLLPLLDPLLSACPSW